MDAVFAYGDKVALDAEGNYYIGSAFSQSIFDRYLKHFDNIILLMRRANVAPDDIETLSGMNKLDSSRIKVEFLPDVWDGIRSFISIRKRREYKRIVIQSITADRAVVVRAPSSAGSIAVEYCRKIGKPVLVEAVGCPWDSLWNHSWKGKVLAPLDWLGMRKTMRHATHAVYVTSEFLQHRYPTRGVQAAISDVELQAMDDSIIERRIEKIKSHSGKIMIATAAAVNVAFKGQQFVIEALAKLKSQGNTDFEYHLAGGGDNTALKNLAEKLGVAEQVVFEGSMSHDEMYAWYDSMDLYIQPSLQEGLPRSVVEAMSRGLPAIGARTGGIPELLGEKYIFARKGIDDIAEILTEVSEDEMLLMAKNNFEHAKLFQREVLEKKRYDFYAAFAAASKGE